MVLLWAWLRALPAAAWAQFVLFLAGLVLAFKRDCRTSVYLVFPLAVAVVGFGAKSLFVYPRYFVHFSFLYVMISVLPVLMVLSRLRIPRGALAAALTVAWLAGSFVSLRMLYGMERCGARSAVEDARESIREGQRIMGVLDAYITVKHYHPAAVSGYKDSDFWREIRGDNPPEFVITMPFGILDIDIPGAREALLEKYEIHREYPSWLDVDDDQDSVYLLRKKGTGVLSEVPWQAPIKTGSE
jgi:hypothetical protein